MDENDIQKKALPEYSRSAHVAEYPSRQYCEIVIPKL